VFDWNHVQYVRAKNYVGVVQVPGVLIEILPKINATASADVPGNEHWARHNLLYMLAVSRSVPILERDVAAQFVHRMKLHETLIAVFAQRLLDELKRGVHHAYVYREENLSVVRGRILLSAHLKHNGGRAERILVGYDDFSADGWLNRILNATCRVLAAVTTILKTEHQLRTIMLQLADVEDVDVRIEDFAKVQLTRNAERFRPFLDFCRLVYERMSAAASYGRAHTFSLLFPMDRLFEEFIGRFLCKYPKETGLNRSRIHLQSRNRDRWLMRTGDGHPVFRLRPDILIEHDDGATRFIVDTKWKLADSKSNLKGGAVESDVYQLYAYANRFAAPTSILLFPATGGASAKRFWLADDPMRRSVHVDFVDLGYELAKDIPRIQRDLRRVLSDAEQMSSESTRRTGV
jgi:5-methylcytosine-specific restriction enzyme subunit McrC